MRPFDLDYYRDILRAAMAGGYQFRGFGETGPGRTVYLRHDIDVSLENAVRLAELEAEDGVQGTYLPLLHAPTYNLMSPHNRDRVRQILDYGHYLGLHYDPMLNHDTELTLADNIYRELDWAEYALGVRPQVISFHRPTKIPFEYCIEIEGIEMTYAPRYFKEIYYYSDSRYQWPGECPTQLFARGEYEHIQLLIHPIWWNEKPGTIEELIQGVSVGFGNQVWEYFRDEIVPRYFSSKEGQE